MEYIAFGNFAFRAAWEVCFYAKRLFRFAWKAIFSGGMAFVSLAALPFAAVWAYVHDAQGVLAAVSVSVFVISIFLMFLASTLYHAIQVPAAKRVFRIIDHSSIYILIAGTYTPILMYIGTRECYMLLAFMYLIVASGITVTILFWEKLKVVHVILYLIMGWLCVFFSADIFPFIPSGIVKFLLLGGLSYTFGLVFYAGKKIPHYHGIWHVFVLLGSIFFYVGILFYLT